MHDDGLCIILALFWVILSFPVAPSRSENKGYSGVTITSYVKSCEGFVE